MPVENEPSGSETSDTKAPAFRRSLFELVGSFAVSLDDTMAALIGRFNRDLLKPFRISGARLPI